MFIRWQKYRSVALWHRGEPPIKRIKAVLVEAVRIEWSTPVGGLRMARTTKIDIATGHST
jgi:hypothetical protein